MHHTQEEQRISKILLTNLLKYMAKRKKKLSEIRDALFSNTSLLGDSNQSNFTKKTVQSDNAVEIDKQSLAKLKLLANYYKKNYKDLIDEALAHYLRIKKLDIDEALRNIVVGDDDE